MELAGRWKVYSGNQAALALRAGREKVRAALSKLVRWGYLDRLVTGCTPPLYTLGPEGSRVLRLPLEEWDAPRAFRLVMAHQLYLRLPEIFEYRADPGSGWDALLEVKGIQYPVVCPRAGEAEVDRCVLVLGLVPEGSRPVVVAATEDEAVRVASRIRAGLQARYVWDDLLREEEFFFYRWTGSRLEPSEKVSRSGIKTLDRVPRAC
ncbi:hypothetical protein [Thermanaeromonas toyohensis]|uniref:hypothetical protein n=1 Tax=Thermanaeromonas toyohensis TaxID=161154 RepID=UPI0012F4B7AA|nr:hypothetical protein [Thermanaeromonas toyohensis]